MFLSPPLSDVSFPPFCFRLEESRSTSSSTNLNLRSFTGFIFLSSFNFLLPRTFSADEILEKNNFESPAFGTLLCEGTCRFDDVEFAVTSRWFSNRKRKRKKNNVVTLGPNIFFCGLRIILHFLSETFESIISCYCNHRLVMSDEGYWLVVFTCRKVL